MSETETNSLAPEIGEAAPLSDASGLEIYRDQQPAFTNLIRTWELDGSAPARYNASVFYIQRDQLYDVEKPYFMNIPVDPSWIPTVRQTNVSYTRKTVAITDIKGHETLFSLDKHGFELGALNTSLCYDDFASTETIVSRFYDEVRCLLQQSTGAVEVLPFDFQVRRKDPSLPANSRGAPGNAQPFGAVHADQTAAASIRRLKYFHPTFADKYANGRFQIINVWKPLHGPVCTSPLAVCDYRTVNADDLVPTDIVFPDYLGETYNFWPNPNHRFYFLDGQEAHEAWMIKCFDSASSISPEIAQFSPHVSFPYLKSNGTEGPRLRESVEVRSFVFYN